MLFEDFASAVSVLAMMRAHHRIEASAVARSLLIRWRRLRTSCTGVQSNPLGLMNPGSFTRCHSSSRSGSGSQSRPARSYRPLMGVAHGATACRVDRGIPTSLAIHYKAPDTLRVSAGDGHFESDAGATWRSPGAGLEVGYLRSIAIDPEHRRSSWCLPRPDRTPRT